MSKSLSISASLSVLMMSAFALFSAHTAHAPIGPDSRTPAAPFAATSQLLGR